MLLIDSDAYNIGIRWMTALAIYPATHITHADLDTMCH